MLIRTVKQPAFLIETTGDQIRDFDIEETSHGRFSSQTTESERVVLGHHRPLTAVHI